jgi:hypothetical protein
LLALQCVIAPEQSRLIVKLPSVALFGIKHWSSSELPCCRVGSDSTSGLMLEWSDALRNAKVVDGCLIMPPGVGESLPAPLRGSLFVRQCYERLWQKELKPMLDAAARGACVITGTPGIGKSKFAMFIIKELAAANKLVYYQSSTYSGPVWRRWDFSSSPPSASFITDCAQCQGMYTLWLQHLAMPEVPRMLMGILCRQQACGCLVLFLLSCSVEVTEASPVTRACICLKVFMAAPDTKASMPDPLQANCRNATDDWLKPTTWLIIDGPLPAGLQYDGLCNSVVLSSPNDTNLHQYLKGE